MPKAEAELRSPTSWVSGDGSSASAFGPGSQTPARRAVTSSVSWGATANRSPTTP